MDIYELNLQRICIFYRHWCIPIWKSNNKFENQYVSPQILRPSTCYSAVVTFIWSKENIFYKTENVFLSFFKNRRTQSAAFVIWNQRAVETDLEGGVGGDPATFFAITLKNYKLCLLKLNWSLPKYYQNIFNTHSFVVWQTVIMLF